MNNIIFTESSSDTEESSSASLLCVQCKDNFHSAWDLMVHAQAAHMLNIYELGLPQSASSIDKSLDSPCHSPMLVSPRPNTPDKVRFRFPGNKQANEATITLITDDQTLTFVCSVGTTVFFLFDFCFF